MAKFSPRATEFIRDLRRRFASHRDGVDEPLAEARSDFGSVDTSLIPLLAAPRTAGIPVVSKPRWGVWAFRAYAALPFVIAAVLIAPNALGASRAPVWTVPPAATAATAAPRPSVLPLASPVTMGRWTFQIADVQWKQRALIMAANPYAGKMTRGQGWAIIPITVRNASDQTLTPALFEVILHAGGTSVSQFAANEGRFRIPDQFTPVGIEPGESLRGNLGFMISDRAESDPGCRIELRVRDLVTSKPDIQFFTCTAG